MSGIKDTATVTLNVNGAQAKQMMSDIEAKIKQTEARITTLKANMADPKDVEKARKQLKTYQKQLEEMKSATEGVNKALGNLDTATPRELEKALRTLNKQLKDMTPGSEVWESHVSKIKELKAQLAELRGELQEQESWWEKLKNWVNDSGATILALGLGFDEVVGTLRDYVDAYADMEQEMANVRKFTGMTEEQVASLNEKFKAIDTRSSREQLNILAQEAGRLGKTSEEDVLGFVRAADKINVALDDLGSGATLTLSKLTGIFGDEERYGTEQALLKVGSVINELSQNCSASAPYLSNFAERMGGVGAQAGMTIQQIMGFGAVLDSNAQRVEASATALSQVIVRLYQNPAKYAKVAGLEVESFSRLMREDANSAILLFLETLQQAGGMDVLSPMFKDMGENGSRAIAALSTLATHIDQVKSQQEAANVAFAEGTSIDKEFAVQNETVQAALDKCKNRANELKVELGERLYPLMKHFLTSGAAIMRGLLTTLKFLDENKSAIITLTAATVAYIAVMKVQALWLNRIAIEEMLVNKHTKLLAVSQKALGGIWASLKLGAAALTNGVAYLRNGLTVTYEMQERWRKSMQAMKFSTWTGLILALGAAVVLLYNHFKKLAEEAKIVENIRKDAIKQMGEEKSKIDILVSAAKNELLSLDERQRAIAKLNALIPNYNGQLDATTGKYRENKKALDDYIVSLTRKYELEGAKKQLADLGQQKAVAAIALSEAQESYDTLKNQGLGHMYITSYGSSGHTGLDAQAHAKQRLDKAQGNYDNIKSKESVILKVYGVDLQKDAVSTETSDVNPVQSKSTPSTPSTTNRNNSKNTPQRFAKETAWRERQEAEARIDYATGETTFAEHTARMATIAADYYQMLLDREDLSSDERLKIQADYWEAVNKETVAGNKLLLDDEERTYQDLLDRLRENHAARLNQ